MFFCALVMPRVLLVLRTSSVSLSASSGISKIGGQSIKPLLVTKYKGGNKVHLKYRIRIENGSAVVIEWKKEKTVRVVT